MIEERVETVALDNGLKLDIYDKSRAVGSDTWLVNILFRVEIGVDERLFADVAGAPALSEVIGRVGESVCFEVRQERNFINESKKGQVFQTLKETYLENTLAYLSHPLFGAKYVLKQYAERMKYTG